MTEARAQFSDLVNRVGFGKERIILTRHGKPLVALVPAETLEELGSEGLRGSTVLDISSQASGSGPTHLTVAAQSPNTPQAG